MSSRARIVPPLLALAIASIAFVSVSPPALALTCPDSFRAAVSVAIEPPVPCNGDSVRLEFRACGPCVRFTGWERSGPEGFLLGIEARDPGECQTLRCVPDSIGLELGRLAEGHYRVRYTERVRLILFDRATGDSLVCGYPRPDSLEFDVSPVCGTPPPPPPLPYVTSITLGLGAGCDTCPPIACHGDSIPVLIQGDTRSNCVWFTGARLIANPSASPLPLPPIIHLDFTKGECSGLACVSGPNPWSAWVLLPPLPARSSPYQLPLEDWLTTYHCSGPPDSVRIAQMLLPFAVVDTCPSQLYGCFVTRFKISGTEPDRCDAFVAPDHPGTAIFQIGSINPLWGLQGEFVLNPPQLAVQKIEPIGAALGMHLRWEPTPTGAKFVLFSDGDAHIPGIPAPPLDSIRYSILSIQVVPHQIDESLPAPRVTMVATNLLGADRNGRGVDPCMFRRELIRLDSYFVFCRESSCDFNGDGHDDVRDLVAMVRCLRDSASCAGRLLPDCDGNGSFQLADVFCCARHVLNPGVPGQAVPDPSLKVRFGVPVAKDGVLEVPVTLSGLHPIGGARLAFRYPDDRYDLLDVAFADSPSWLGLHEATAGRIEVGLLDLGSGNPGAQLERTFTLRLAPRPGQAGGGEVSLADADIVDASGTTLTAELGAPSVTLEGGSVRLAPARPNPFARSTTFAVTLPKGGDLEVTVHDVSGRTVATLQHGSVTPGAHSFRWDGVRGDGSRAADGIYFVRARVAGEMVSRKVVLLRQP
jgi:hypothetical protein